MVVITPKYYSVVSGVGESKYPLVAFDHALRQAGIGDYNLVEVSSVLPPRCERKECVDIPKGSILYTAYATLTVSSGEKGTVAAAVAIPASDCENGVIFHTSHTDMDAEEHVCNMCREAMGSRIRQIAEIQSSCVNVYGQDNGYICGFAGVVMW